MILNIFKSLTLIFVFSFLAFSQTSPIERSDKSREQASAILTKAREAISTKRKIAEVKALYLDITESSSDTYLANNQPISTEETSKVEINLENPVKLRLKMDTNHNVVYKGSQSVNQSLSDSILNGDNYWEESGAYVNGVKMGVPPPAAPKEESIATLKNSIFRRVFPVTLDSSSYLPVDFYYAGIAESGATRADIVDAVMPDQSVYRLFFDQKSNLLLMMTQTKINKSNQKTERKFFYSDYAEKDGLLVATKIKSEFSWANGKSTSQNEIKTLKVNPVTKSNLFAVKEK